MERTGVGFEGDVRYKMLLQAPTCMLITRCQISQVNVRNGSTLKEYKVYKSSTSMGNAADDGRHYLA